MSDEPMEPTHRPKGVLVTLRAGVESLLFWIRKILGLGLSVLQRDSITSLRLETEQFSAAAIESATYVGEELRAFDERLTSLEEQITGLRELLEERQAVNGPSTD